MSFGLHDTGEKQPPFFRLTDDDRGGAGVVVALCTIIITLAVSGIRGVVAARQRVGFRGDDATFYLAAFLGASSSICVFRSVLVGLGKRIDNIGSDELESFYSLIYTAHLLAILSMTFSKVSVVMLLKRIAQTVSSRFNFCLIIVTIWGIFSFFAIAFQCQLPHPWVFVPTRCNTHGYLQYPVIALNILTDVLLGTAILPTIWRLNVARNTRLTVMVLFGLRLIVSLFAIGEMISVTKSIHNPDQTWVGLSRFTWMMLVTHASVITATIPRTHSFWASLQTGKASTAITDQEYELSASPLNSHRFTAAKFQKFITTSQSNIRNQTTSRNRGKSQPLSSREPSRRRESRGSVSGSEFEMPLRLVPRYDGDLRTRVYSEGITGTQPRMGQERSVSHGERGREHREREGFGVWRESEFAVEVEYLEERERVPRQIP